MKPNDERKLTFDEEVELLYQQMMASRVPKPKPATVPKPVAAEKAQERWAAKAKPLGAVLQDAQLAEAAATERLRKEREEREREETFEVVSLAPDNKTVIRRKTSLEDYQAELHQAWLRRRQAEIDAAWQRNLDYQRELALWGGCHRGPGDPDWPGR
jgi:hypothetical protein